MLTHLPIHYYFRRLPFNYGRMVDLIGLTYSKPYQVAN